MKTDKLAVLSGINHKPDKGQINRREFFHLSVAGAAGLALSGGLSAQDKSAEHTQKPPAQINTNISDLLVPRTDDSLPGKFPGKVVQVATGDAASDMGFDRAKIKKAVEQGLLELTGEKDIKKAWLTFVSPKDVIGLKLNPIGGKLLSNRPEMVDVLIEGLTAAGVPKSNIIIWDRRLFQLEEAGYTKNRYPGIRILGTEMKGPNDDFYNEKGELWAKDNIDRDYPAYSAGVEMKYNKNMLPYMINEGKESYFTKIVTRTCDKIINVPVLKNAGPTVTLCLKNLSFGSLSNTSRLHKVWNKAVAEPCAVPCLRDKVVLNIVDGLKACYEGGPGANAQYIYFANMMFFGTDPVAVDTVGHEYIIKERMKRGVQQFEDKSRRSYLEIAGKLGLGFHEREKIQLKTLNLT